MADQSPNPLQMIAQIIGQYGLDPNAKVTIGNDNSLKLDYNPANNPKNADKQMGGALQAAGRSSAPPNLEGILDPKVMQMLAGNQQNLQEMALQVPQALSGMRYQEALANQADRGPQELIMRLAGQLFQQHMQGQQGLATKQAVEGTGAAQIAADAPYRRAQIGHLGAQTDSINQETSQNNMMFGTDWAAKLAGIENVMADTAYKEANTGAVETPQQRMKRELAVRSTLPESEAELNQARSALTWMQELAAGDKLMEDFKNKDLRRKALEASIAESESSADLRGMQAMEVGERTSQLMKQRELNTSKLKSEINRLDAEADWLMRRPASSETQTDRDKIDLQRRSQQSDLLKIIASNSGDEDIAPLLDQYYNISGDATRVPIQVPGRMYGTNIEMLDLQGKSLDMVKQKAADRGIPLAEALLDIYNYQRGKTK